MWPLALAFATLGSVRDPSLLVCDSFEEAGTEFFFFGNKRSVSGLICLALTKRRGAQGMSLHVGLSRAP